MAAGDANDNQRRLLSVIPAGWFGPLDGLQNAVFGGLSDALSWIHTQASIVRSGTRRSGTTGWLLDIDAWGWFGARFLRRYKENDDSWRARYLKEIFRQRSTRTAISAALNDLTGHVPIIFEPWNTNDTGVWGVGMAWAGATAPQGGGGAWNKASGWGAGWQFNQPRAADALTSGGAGAWGSTLLPFQMFLTAQRPGLQGIPNIAGWACPQSAWGGGAWEWVTEAQVVGQVTDHDIFSTITRNKVAGTIAWTRLN